MQGKGTSGSTLADRLSAALFISGMNKSQLARKAKLSTGQITHLVKGNRGKRPEALTLIKLAGALGVSLEWLATGEGAGRTSA